MTRFYLGSINTQGPWFHATGEGLTVCELDESTGTITRTAKYPAVENAIWITPSADRLYIATERFLDSGEIGVFDHKIARIGAAQKTPGGAICHLAIAPDGRNLYAASYLGGITVHSMDLQGGIAPAHQTIHYQGSGANKDRQQGPHPHQAVVSPDGKQLFVCDLGSDRIRVHSIECGTLGDTQDLVAPAGSGPRHLVFHPKHPRFYLLGELDAKVHVFENNGTGWKVIASHSALPAGFSGTPGGGAIKFHPSGKTLAVSVRGSDNIAVFPIDERGDLGTAQTFSTRGKTPRDFGFSPSGRQLLALNQDSDNVVVFEFNAATGLPTGHASEPFAIGCPVCVVF